MLWSYSGMLIRGVSCWKVRLIALVFCVLPLQQTVLAGNARGRPVISGGTLKTDQGTLLRAVNSWSNKYTFTLAENAGGSCKAIRCCQGFQHADGF